MHQNTSMKGFFASLLLALTLLLGACGETANISEDEVIARAKEELALMQAFMPISVEKISADVSKCAVTYENVNMSVHGVPSLRMNVKKISSSGMDVPSYEGKYGEKTTIAEMLYSGIEFYLDGENIGSLAEYRIEGMNIAYRDFIQMLRDNQTVENSVLMRKAAPYLSGYTAKLILASDMRFNVEDVTASIGKMEARDVTLGNYGPASVSNLQIITEGNEFISFDKLGYASLVMPDIYKQIATTPDENAMMMIMFGVMQNPMEALNKLDVKGFYLENLNLAPGSPSLNLDKLAGDLSIKDNVMNVVSNVQGLNLSQAFLNDIGEMIAEAANGQGLLLDGTYNMEMSTPAENERKTVISSSLLDRQLGNVSGKITLTTKQNPEFRYDTQEYLHNLEVTADDSGILDVLFAFYASNQFYGAESYSATLQDFLAEAHAAKTEISNPALQDALNKFLLTLQNGGKYSLSLNPAAPLNMDDLGEVFNGNGDTLGLSSSHTPPATPKKR